MYSYHPYNLKNKQIIAYNIINFCYGYHKKSWSTFWQISTKSLSLSICFSPPLSTSTCFFFLSASHYLFTLHASLSLPLPLSLSLSHTHNNRQYLAIIHQIVTGYQTSNKEYFDYNFLSVQSNVGLLIKFQFQETYHYYTDTDV